MISTEYKQIKVVSPNTLQKNMCFWQDSFSLFRARRSEYLLTKSENLGINELEKFYAGDKHNHYWREQGLYLTGRAGAPQFCTQKSQV
jgi:hypothetical protein